MSPAVFVFFGRRPSGENKKKFTEDDATNLRRMLQLDGQGAVGLVAGPGAPHSGGTAGALPGARVIGARPRQHSPAESDASASETRRGRGRSASASRVAGGGGGGSGGGGGGAEDSDKPKQKKPKKFDAVAVNSRIRRSLVAKVATARIALKTVSKKQSDLMLKMTDDEKSSSTNAALVYRIEECSKLADAWQWEPPSLTDAKAGDAKWKLEIDKTDDVFKLLPDEETHMEVVWKKIFKALNYIIEQCDGKEGQDAIDALTTAVDLERPPSDFPEDRIMA